MEEVNLVRSIWSHKLLILLVASAFAAAGVVIASLRAADYASEAGLLVQDPRSPALSDSRRSRDEVRYVADQIEVLKSAALLERASKLTRSPQDPGGIPTQELKAKTSLRTSDVSNFIGVRFTSRDPEKAKLGTNSIARAYRALVLEDLNAETGAALKRLNDSITKGTKTLAVAATPEQKQSLRSFLRRLRAQRSRIQADSQVTVDGVALFSPAQLGKRQGAPLPSIAIVAFVLGGLIGIGLAYVIDARKPAPARRRPPDLASLDIRTLAEIPDFSVSAANTSLPALHAPGSAAAEAFRALAASVALLAEAPGASIGAQLTGSLQDEFPGMTERELAVVNRLASKLDEFKLASEQAAQNGEKEEPVVPQRSVAFVSGSAGGGTTTLTANTALAAAQGGDRVLVLDGDLVAQGLTRLLLGKPLVGAEEKPVGLTDMLLSGIVPEGIKSVIETTSGGSLSLIEPGSTTLTAMNAIRPELVRPQLDATRDRFDRIFIDVPPLFDFPHAISLVKSVDVVVVVVPDSEDELVLAQVVDRLGLLGVPPVGLVSNHLPTGRHAAEVPARGLRSLGRRGKKEALEPEPSETVPIRSAKPSGWNQRSEEPFVRRGRLR